VKKERQIGVRVGLPVFFAPELQRILQRAPKTGEVEIKIWMKGNRLVGTMHKISEQEQGKAPEGTGT
jgi:hypothetical protein